MNHNGLTDLEQMLRTMSLRETPASLDARILRPWWSRAIPPTAAAALIIAAATVAAWFAYTSNENLKSDSSASQVNVEQTLAREESAAKLLAAANILGRQPGAEPLATKMVKQVALMYPDTLAGKQIDNFHIDIQGDQ